MRYQKWFFGAVLVLGLLASTTSAALEPTFTTIDVPGASSTNASGINDRGQIVGTFRVTGQGIHGFLLD